MRSSRAPNGLTKAEWNGDVGGGISSSRSKTGAKGRKNRTEFIWIFRVFWKGKRRCVWSSKIEKSAIPSGFKDSVSVGGLQPVNQGRKCLPFFQVAKKPEDIYFLVLINGMKSLNHSSVSASSWFFSFWRENFDFFIPLKFMSSNKKCRK